MARKVLAVGILTAALIVAAGIAATGAGFSPLQTNRDAPGDDTPGLVTSVSGPKCLDDAEITHSGWIHSVANGERYSVTFDVAVLHGKTEEVAVDISHAIGGTYDLEITTENRPTDESSAADPDCDLVTRVKGGASVPTEFETVRVRVNGEVVGSIEKNGTGPIMRPLPNPVET